MKRIAIVASASGNGKTTLARALATRLGAPCIELDALVHGPNWEETPDDVLRGMLEPMLAAPAWVVDGVYHRKIGSLVLDAADAVVWLDLPIRVWLPRLVRRTVKRAISPEPLWNGNRETLRGILWGRDSLLVYSLRSHLRRRLKWPRELARYHVVRLRTPREVREFLDSL